jgi:biopolymer transport protein ExbB/TolQ
MTLTFLSIFLDIMIFLVVILLIIGISSFFIVKEIQKEYKKVFRAHSRFEIELRKLVNLLFKFYEHSKLEPYNNVVINLLKIIEEVYLDVDPEIEENKYIVETYKNLEEIRRVRDSKVIVFNQKIGYFPFNFYIKVMKLERFDTFVEKE